MRIFAIVACALGLAACGRCGDAGTSADLPRLPAVPGDASVAADVPMPGAVYKEAYDRARNEVTAENARDRLDDLERAIDREAEAMH